MALAQGFADVAAIGILQHGKATAAEDRAEQAQQTLDSPPGHRAAQGALPERASVSPEEAFQRIRRYARGHNEKLRAVCDRVTHSGLAPE